MRLPGRIVLVFAALTASAFLTLAVVACEEEEEAVSPTPVTTSEVTPAATPEEEERTPTAAGELPEVAVYPGAVEVSSGTYAAGELPIAVPGTLPFKPSEYGDVRYTVFTTGDSPEDVLDFYQKQFKGWKEEFSSGGEAEGSKYQMRVWSKDDGQLASWLVASQVAGTTTAMVAWASR